MQILPIKSFSSGHLADVGRGEGHEGDGEGLGDGVQDPAPVHLLHQQVSRALRHILGDSPTDNITT